MHTLNIVFVCDYFYPNIGGVETHIFNIGKELVGLGHKVIIVTHQYKNFTGQVTIKGMKVYYENFFILYGNTAFPTLLGNYKIFKRIFTDEKVDIVHSHQSTSTLAVEAIFQAKCMKIKTCFTEHSLFSTLYIENVFLNSFNRHILAHATSKFTVSVACRDNFIRRFDLKKEDITIVKNSTDFNIFYPSSRKNEKLTLIFAARLEERKGITIFIKLLRYLDRKNFKGRVLIAGDGSYRKKLVWTIKKMKNVPVQYFGTVPHEKMGRFLRRGNIFLNTSLTESFCMGILEASACGLYVISTDVGGVRNVLPKNSISLCNFSYKNFNKTIKAKRNFLIKKMKNYEILQKKYSWKKSAIKYQNEYFSIWKKTEENYISTVKNIFFKILIIFNQFLLRQYDY